MNYSWITSPDRQAYHELLLLGDEDEGMLARYANVQGTCWWRLTTGNQLASRYLCRFRKI
jgi:hypothetical protein